MANAETIRRGSIGKIELRLVRSSGRLHGMADGKPIVQGDDADEVWQRLLAEAGRSDHKYFGFSGARARFLYWFADGFQSAEFLKNERDYKIAAKRKLEGLTPEDAATGTGHGPLVWTAFQTNLLSPYEKMWVREALQGPRADEFVQAAARFTLGEGKSALLTMERALKPHGADKWTIVTYLPFLWRPQEHMYLKPEATKDFAIRVGHHFAHNYHAKLELEVYGKLASVS